MIPEIASSSLIRPNVLEKCSPVMPHQLVRMMKRPAGAFISANVPLLRIDYEPLSLFRGGLHVYELSCEIQTLAIMHERVEPRRPRAAHPAETTRRAVRVDVLHLKLDGSFSYDSQTVTGKMQATLHDVQDVESFRSLLKSP